MADHWAVPKESAITMRLGRDGTLYSPCCDSTMTEDARGTVCDECGVVVIGRLLWPVQRDLRAEIAAEIEAFADDHSDVSDAYRHAALIAKGTPGP